MSVTLPTDGQEDWDVPLNAALTALDSQHTAHLTADSHTQYVRGASASAPSSPVTGQEYRSASLVDVRVTQGPMGRTRIISPASGGYEGGQSLEPSVWVYGTSYHMLYTVGNNTLSYASCPTSADPTVAANWTKNGAVVLGGGVGGQTNGAGHSSVYVEGSTAYCFFVDTTANTVKVATAALSAPTVWTTVGTVLTRPSGSFTMGNVFVVNDGGTYRLFYEGDDGVSNIGWQTWVATSSTVTGSYTLAYGPLTTPRPATNASVSGCWIGKEGSTWIMFFHSGPQKHSLPTNIYRATATTLASDSWSLTDAGAPIVRRGATSYEWDQVADPWVLTTTSGVSYLFWEGYDNRAASSIRSYIFAAPLVPVGKHWNGAQWSLTTSGGDTFALPTNGGTPWMHQWSASSGKADVLQGTWDTVLDTTAFGNAHFYNSTNAQDDAVCWPVLLSPGTWRLELSYMRDVNRAFVECCLDGGGDKQYWGYNIANFDGYNATTVANSIFSGDFTVYGDEPMMRNMRFRAHSRNASNTTGWFISLRGWTLRRLT